MKNSNKKDKNQGKEKGTPEKASIEKLATEITIPDEVLEDLPPDERKKVSELFVE